MTDQLDSQCPKCGETLIQAKLPCRAPSCTRCGSIVDKIYSCRCGRSEEFRAIDNVPRYAHYCGICVKALAPDVRMHLERVVAVDLHSFLRRWRPA